MGFSRNGYNNSLIRFYPIQTEYAKHRAESVIVDIHKCKILAEDLCQALFSVMQKYIIYGSK